ncbi:MAG: sulfate/thiosulfate ABC transporter permease CysW, partial [Phycisphaerae bacterium]|nr:sulfate/thiosulfate ABC transporter permease CysW [Phycisphaerae bacterium]
MNSKTTKPETVFRESRLAKWTLITIAIAFLCLFLLLPLLAVFAEALRNGTRAYFASLTTPDTL